jgi:dTDP-4-dehydrorhamnose 3,5-epimerase
MKVRATAIAGVMVVDTERQNDHRGSFARLFCKEALRAVLGAREIVQINHSRTRSAGAVRGLHFQRPPCAEMKLVRCLKGKVWDVALDLRAESATLLKWHAEELSAENGRLLVIPEGCAHGFQVLSPESELLYLHTAFYTPSAEGGVRPDDPRLGIPWPLPIQDLSARDRSHALLADPYVGLTP